MAALLNLQPVLEKQSRALAEIEKVSKQDRLIQLAQLYEEKRLDNEGESEIKELKSVNNNLKKVVEKLDDGTKKATSNIIKLGDHIKKTTGSAKSRELDNDEKSNILDKVQARPQFNGMQNFKDDLKDMFTFRGFMDKVSPLSTFGIGVRGGKGILSSALDKQEAKKKYIDARLETQGSTFGSKETFARQFDEQQEIQTKIGKNQERIKELRDMGFDDDAIKRSGLLKEQDRLATEMAKSDTRVRPEGFDPRTGKVKNKKTPELADSESKSAKVIPFTKATDGGLGNEENMLEQNRMVAEQSVLLTKIEENTRSLKGSTTQGQGSTQQPAAESSGGGLMDMLGNGAGRLGKLAKTAGKGLGRAAMGAGRFLAQRAGPLAAAAAVAGGAYTAYTGYNEAGEKESGALKDIDAKVASGEISEDEAKKLRVQAREEGTVNRSGAVGEGTGQAVGGAAGALKGAAVGAAIGSAVPVVGTVIGGAIGATVGAIGGSWLGGKGGKWLGEKFGQAKNWMFGKSSESDAKVQKEETGSSVSIDFSEAQFAEKDPDTYKKFAAEREELAKKYAEEKAQKVGRKEPSPIDRKVAYNKANVETIQKYRKEIEAAGAGKVTGGKKDAPGQKTEEALKKTADGITPASKGETVGKMASAEEAKAFDTAYSQARADGKSVRESKEIGQQARAAIRPSSGDTISKASGENETARLDATKGGGGNNIVSAPTVNNVQNVQNNAPKLPPRNTDNTVNRYLQKTYAF